MKLRNKIIFFVGILAILGWLLHLINSILSPFICAIIVAYFLDPLASNLEKHKFSRTAATATIVGAVIVVAIVIVVLIVPILYYQFIALIHSLPSYIEIGTQKIYPKIIHILGEVGIDLNPDIKSYLVDQDVRKILGYSDDILGNIMRSGMAFFNILSLVFVTPILVFYMIRDWNIFIAKINHLIPSQYSPTVRKFFTEIDKTLSGYVRGQFNVCLILGMLYAIGLVSIGLDFGFLIGFLTGFMSFIPYVGMLVGVITALIVGLFQDNFGVNDFIMMTVIFFIGQIIESNFLTPKLIGNKVGIHPVWIIFGLFSFGIIFGFVGLLLAVPMTAIIGVVVKFLLIEYKKKLTN